MPPKRRPRPYEKGATGTTKSNGSDIRPTTAGSLAKQKPPSSPGFSKSTSNWRRPKNVSNPDYKSRIETLWKNVRGFEKIRWELIRDRWEMVE